MNSITCANSAQCPPEKLSVEIRLINVLTSSATAARPILPRLLNFSQGSRKRRRCQASAAESSTNTRASRHLDQCRESQDQGIRSISWIRGCRVDRP